MAAITVSDIAQAPHAEFHTKRADVRRAVDTARASGAEVLGASATAGPAS